MKKKLIAAVTGICMIAGALSGCSSDTAEKNLPYFIIHDLKMNSNTYLEDFCVSVQP